MVLPSLHNSFTLSLSAPPGMKECSSNAFRKRASNGKDLSELGRELSIHLNQLMIASGECKKCFLICQLFKRSWQSNSWPLNLKALPTKLYRPMGRKIVNVLKTPGGVAPMTAC
jgi:hypothetical protein